MMRQTAKRLSIMALAVTICALAAMRGEARVLTLISTEVLSTEDMTISADDQGKPVGLVALNFQTDSMPSKARITGATLVMYCDKVLSTAYQTVTAYVPDGSRLAQSDVEALKGEVKLPEKYKLLGANDSLARRPKRSEAAKWRAGVLPKDRLEAGLTLLLRTVGGDGRKWYSADAQDSNLHPRLILEYTAMEEPTTAQPAAVRSGRSFLPDRNHPNSQKSYRTLGLLTGNAWSYAPAFHGGFVYLMTDQQPNKVLSWHRPLGAIAAPPVELPVTDPGQHLLVSESGHLYIVGNKKIFGYRIGADGTPALRRTVEVPGLNPRAENAPTLGANGSIYYVSGTVQEGWTAVGRNPDLQELWKVFIGDKKTSRVTVGPSGQYVYLTTQKEGLVTIDARTGETFKSPLPNQQALENADNPALHAPVVIRHKNRTEKVYVAANSGKGGVLALFDNGKTRADAEDDARVEAVEEWEPLKALVGQPLVSDFDPKRIYVVRAEGGKAELVSLDWLTGAPPEQRSPTFIVGKDGPYLLNGGNLATDKDGNIFLWNGDTETHLRGFTPALELLFREELSGVQSQANLWFGTDGSLYAGAISKADLRAVLPHYTLGTDTQDTNIYSPTHLSVDGEAGQKKKWILKAGGTVLLGNGSSVKKESSEEKRFSVKKGTTLRVKVGVRN